MATRGYVRVSGCTRDGQWVVSPGPVAIDVLRQALQYDAPVLVQVVVPRRCRVKNHTLKLADYTERAE
jgi:hypothetical protein